MYCTGCFYYWRGSKELVDLLRTDVQDLDSSLFKSEIQRTELTDYSLSRIHQTMLMILSKYAGTIWNSERVKRNILVYYVKTNV